MKSCPTCNRTFEDTLTYCLVDGSILSAPFNPQATIVIPSNRKTDPPPTEILFNSPSLPPRESASLTPKPKRLWLRLILAIIFAVVISWAMGAATYGLSYNLIWRNWDSANVTAFIVFFSALAILLMLIFRWWRKQRAA